MGRSVDFGATRFKPGSVDDAEAFPENLVDQRVLVTGVGLDPDVAFGRPHPKEHEGCDTTFATRIEVLE